MALPLFKQDIPLGEEPESAAHVKLPNEAAESTLNTNLQSTSATSHRPSKDLKVQRCCLCSSGFTRAKQNLARGFMFISSAIILAYIPLFQSFIGESIEFLVVLAAVMGRRPVAHSNLGWQNMICINLLLGKLRSP